MTPSSSGRSNDSSFFSPTTTPSVGSLVGRFGLRKLCWQAQGIFRDKYQQNLVIELTETLGGHFGSVPGTEHCTLSLYMIGRSAQRAIPTVLLISRNKQSRRRVRNLLRDSDIQRDYPEFNIAYVDRDPGSQHIMPLTSDIDAEYSPVTDDTTVVLFDERKALSFLGIQIFIRHSSGLRPATANAVRSGDQIYLQTVYHAFHDDLANGDSIPMDCSDNMVIDIDSDSEADSDPESESDLGSEASVEPEVSLGDDAHIDGASIRARLPYDRSNPSRSNSHRRSVLAQMGRVGRLEAGRLLNDSSRSSTSITIEAEQPDTITHVPKLTDMIYTAQEDYMTQASSVQKGSTDMLVDIDGQSTKHLSVLGKLVNTSLNNDLALIHITNTALEERLRSITKHNKGKMAYEQVVSSPKDDLEVFTYTASAGKLYGTLCSAPSYTRIGYHEIFQRIYVVRFKGRLATGDGGSVVMAQTTKVTYGHLVAGCQATGVAYIMAADPNDASCRISSLTTILDRMSPQDSRSQPQTFSHERQVLSNVNTGSGDIMRVQTPSIPSMRQTKMLDTEQSQNLSANSPKIPDPVPKSLSFGRILSESAAVSMGGFHLKDQGLLSFLHKEWPREFSRIRKPCDERIYIDSLHEAIRASKVEAYRDSYDQNLWLQVEPDGDDHQLFMEANSDELTSLDIQSALQFLQSIKNHKLHDQFKTGKKGTAWLDDRTYDSVGPPQSLNPRTNTESHEPSIYDTTITSNQVWPTVIQSVERSSPTWRRSRRYPAPLNAVDLHKFLRERQFDHSQYLDADRRLIYISDPDAYDLSALVTTARAHQERALRDAICNHLALGTSIKATIRPGYTVFQLEFHVPFFAMRRCRPEQDFVQRKKRTHRGWMNLSFLDSKDTDPEADGVCGIHQAHISVTLGGTDNTRWFVYCFEDTHFDEDSALGQDEQTEAHQSDQIARGDFGAEISIWDPREYFLRVFLIRMSQVQKEWEELVRFIETGVKEFSWSRYFSARDQDGTPQIVDDSAASSRIDCTLQLLCKLTEDIAKTKSAWKRFTSPTGDLAFILDEKSDTRMFKTFWELNDIFTDLSEMEARLQRIAEQCEKNAQTVNLRLASRSKRNAELAVYFISPLAIVSTFFAIPVPIIAFDRNLSSFLIAMLLYTIVLQTLLYLWSGNIRQQRWWQKLSRRAKAVMQGDPTLTTQGAGSTVLQRRKPYSYSFD